MLGSAIKTEFEQRLPYYIDDWKSGFSLKVLSSTFFCYFIHIIPAITFGVFLQKTTGVYGVTEVLSATSLCGILFSVFAGQPLVIVGVTGPISIFSSTLFVVCTNLGIPYLGFMFWIAIWASVMHLVLALWSLCLWVRYVSRFTCEIFANLIGLLFLYEGIVEILKSFGSNTAIGGWVIVLAILTVALAEFLDSAKTWKFLPLKLCGFFSDYSMAITVLLVSCITAIPSLRSIGISFLKAPPTFQTTSGRSWIVDPMSNSVGMIFGAILPAFVLTVLIFFDHNVSSLLSQKPSLNLKKPASYNYDFVIVALTMIVTGVLGLPFTHGLIPQAPLHSLSLAEIDYVTIHVDGVTKTVPKVKGVVENRLSNFMISLLIGITAISPPLLWLIGQIPEAVLAGIFLYMGIETLSGNQFTNRIYLFFARNSFRSLYFAHHSQVSLQRVHLFTIIQIVCLAAIFGITFTPAAISFPVLIGLLVPVRMYLLPKIFSDDELIYLDAEDKEETTEPAEEIVVEDVSSSQAQILQVN